MLTKKTMRQSHWRLLGFACVLFHLPLCVTPLMAAPVIPDAATPGGALPRTLDDQAQIPTVGDNLTIPKVVERPLGVDEGARVRVREFVLNGVQTREEFGIRKEDVAFIAEVNRVRRQRLDEADMKGFTPEEVDKIAEFIRQLVEEPNQRPTSAELWKLVFKLRKSEWNRGLTIGQMQEIADEITRYYRQHGLILATAYIPAQDVVDGRVSIELLEGTLGEVSPESNQMYSSGLIQRPFRKLKQNVIDQDGIESGLLYLSDYPGLQVSGVFQPGKQFGQSDLVLKVLSEKRLNGGLYFDNNGSEFTGQYRARMDFTVNNPTGTADRLNFSVLQLIEPTNSVYGGLEYQIPLFRQDLLGLMSVSHNQFKVDQLASLEVTGDSTSASIGLKKYFKRHRKFNSYGSAVLSRKRSHAELGFGQEDNTEYDVGKLEFGFDQIDTRYAGINFAILQVHHGLGTLLGAEGFDTQYAYEGGFRKLNLNLSRLQTLRRNFSLLMSGQFQYAFDRLNSLEQLAIGGADSVRAFPVSEYLRDVGYNVSLEAIVNAPGFANKPAFASRSWGEIFSLSLFYDIGGGWLRNADASEVREVAIQGAGVALKLSVPGKFKVRLQAAQVIGSEKPLNDNDERRLYFDMAYYF